MKKSKFIVSQKGKLPGTILIYSTFSTSLVELEEIIYKTIFENADFESYPSEVDALDYHYLTIMNLYIKI